MLLTLDKLLEAARESRQQPRSAAERRLAPGVLAALAQGEPVTLERVESLGRDAGLTGRELETAVAGIRDSSSLGADGSVRAFMGLSLDPTPHRFVVEGRTLYTWCAHHLPAGIARQVGRGGVRLASQRSRHPGLVRAR